MSGVHPLCVNPACISTLPRSPRPPGLLAQLLPSGRNLQMPPGASGPRCQPQGHFPLDRAPGQQLRAKRV